MPKDPSLASISPGRPRLPGWAVLMGLLIISAVLTGLPENYRSLFKLYADQRLSNHYWGWISGHLLHYSWPHFFLNAAGLLLWSSLYGGLKSWCYWLGASLFIMLAIDVGLLLKADFSWYVGFSGVLHGLLAHAALLGDGLKSSLNRIVLFALLIKISLESLGLISDLSSSVTQIDTAYETHLYGVAGGLLWWLLLYFYDRSIPQKTSMS